MIMPLDSKQRQETQLCEAIFLQRLNTVIVGAHPDIMMIAEESSSATKIYFGMKEMGGLALT